MKKLYFPHDFYASDDVKLQDVMMDLGAEGIGVYWMIIERLYRDGGILPLRNIRALAFNFRVKEDVITKLISDYGLFEQDENNFWSPSAVNRQKKIEELSEKRKSAINSRWGKCKEVDSNVIQNDTNVLQLNQESIQTEYNCITNEQESDTNVIQIDTNAIQNDTTAIQTEYKSIQNKNKNKNKNKIDNYYIITGDNAREENSEQKESAQAEKLEIKSNDDNFFNEMSTDEYWRQIMCMNNRIKPPQLDEYLQTFYLECQCKSTTHTNIAHCKQHFFDWLRIQLNKKAKEEKEEKRKNTKNHGNKCFTEDELDAIVSAGLQIDYQ